MKMIRIYFALTLGCLLFLSLNLSAQKTLPRQWEVKYTAVKMTPAEVNAVLNQGDSPQLNRQIKAEGYKAESTLTATKYVGSDSFGNFEIIVIEQSYDNNLKNKSQINTEYYQAKRGNTVVKVQQIAFDNSNEYKAGSQKLQRVAAPTAATANSLSNCYSKFIMSWGSCSAAGNSIKNCINGCPKNARKKPKFGCAVGCVLSNAAKFKSCINNVVALTNCIIDNW